MTVEMAAGFAAVIACLLAITILVFTSRGVIEKIHRESFHTQAEAEPGSDDNGNRGDSR